MDSAAQHNPGELSYFVEWGGRAWERLTRLALAELAGSGGLEGARLLEIGTRYGRMAVLFSRLGAHVTAIDVRPEPLEQARMEARKWNVPNIDFRVYNGDLDELPDDSFDVVFTKSVLVVVPDLQRFLGQLVPKLTRNGRVVFIENRRGNSLVHALRRVRHVRHEIRRVNYFTDREAELLETVFEPVQVRQTSIPPVLLFVGRKRR